MNIQTTLMQLGLEQREIKIYISLLKLGPASIRDIATKADINRGTTYEVLKNLQKKKMVGFYPMGKRKYFCAEKPEKLLVIAQEKNDEIQKAVGQLKNDIIPSLNLLKQDTGFTNVRYYEGDDGIELVLKDILNTVSLMDEKNYDIYSSKAIREHLYRPFPNYTKQRVQKNIKVRVIALGEGGESAPLAERKWLPASEKFASASYVAIYPPKCAMISLTEEDYPTAVIMDSSAIALTLKITFDTLWELL